MLADSSGRIFRIRISASRDVDAKWVCASKEALRKRDMFDIGWIRQYEV